MDYFGYWDVWVSSTGQDFMVLLMDGIFSPLLLSLLCFGMRMRWNQNRKIIQEPSEGGKGVCGISLWLLEGDWEGESLWGAGDTWHKESDKGHAGQSGTDGGTLDNQLISQSITVVDCPSLSTSRLEASPEVCKIQVQAWNKSYWWSQETSEAAVTHSGVESGCKFSSCALKSVQVRPHGFQNVGEKTSFSSPELLPCKNTSLYWVTFFFLFQNHQKLQYCELISLYSITNTEFFLVSNHPCCISYQHLWERAALT